MEVSIHLRRPHAQQRAFLDSPLKRKIIRAGRRSGKTTGVAIAAIQAFLAGRRVLYSVPVADQIRVFWREVVNALWPMIEAGAFLKNETEHIIEEPGFTRRIKAKTAWNADSLRGDYADLLILDEWQLMDEDAWGEVGAPMLLDNNGDAIFCYTPPSLHSQSVSKARDPRHAAKMFKAAQQRPDRWLAIHFTSYDNPHISREGLAEITQDMAKLSYEQEILAHDIENIPGALWTRELIESTRVDRYPADLARVIIGVDPSGSTNGTAGICVVGKTRDGQGYVIRDASIPGATPQQWASRAVSLYHEYFADRIVAERNYGGDMVAATIKTIDKEISVKLVQASRSKQVRAEPVMSLYQCGRMHHVGYMPELEDQMCSFIPGESQSPDRMDAMVWAATECLLGPNLGIFDYYKTQAEENLARLENQVVLDSETIQLQHADEYASIIRERFNSKIGRA